MKILLLLLLSGCAPLWDHSYPDKTIVYEAPDGSVKQLNHYHGEPAGVWR